MNRNFDFEDCDDLDDFDLTTIRDQGIVLIVGFVPGLKVDAIPLLRESEVWMLCLNHYTDFFVRIFFL